MESEMDSNAMMVKRVSVPLGLEEIMKELTKEVILKKPKDIYLFASEYFSHQINLREKSPHEGYKVKSAQFAVKSISKQNYQSIIKRHATKENNTKSSISTTTRSYKVSGEISDNKRPNKQDLSDKKVHEKRFAGRDELKQKILEDKNQIKISRKMSAHKDSINESLQKHSNKNLKLSKIHVKATGEDQTKKLDDKIKKELKNIPNIDEDANVKESLDGKKDITSQEVTEDNSQSYVDGEIVKIQTIINKSQNKEEHHENIEIITSTDKTYYNEESEKIPHTSSSTSIVTEVVEEIKSSPTKEIFNIENVKEETNSDIIQKIDETISENIKITKEETDEDEDQKLIEEKNKTHSENSKSDGNTLKEELKSFNEITLKGKEQLENISEGMETTENLEELKINEDNVNVHNDVIKEEIKVIESSLKENEDNIDFSNEKNNIEKPLPESTKSEILQINKDLKESSKEIKKKENTENNNDNKLEIDTKDDKEAELIQEKFKSKDEILEKDSIESKEIIQETQENEKLIQNVDIKVNEDLKEIEIHKEEEKIVQSGNNILETILESSNKIDLNQKKEEAVSHINEESKKDTEDTPEDLIKSIKIIENTEISVENPIEEQFQTIEIADTLEKVPINTDNKEEIKLDNEETVKLNDLKKENDQENKIDDETKINLANYDIKEEIKSDVEEMISDTKIEDSEDNNVNVRPNNKQLEEDIQCNYLNKDNIENIKMSNEIENFIKSEIIYNKTDNIISKDFNDDNMSKDNQEKQILSEDDNKKIKDNNETKTDNKIPLTEEIEKEEIISMEKSLNDIPIKDEKSEDDEELKIKQATENFLLIEVSNIGNNLIKTPLDNIVNENSKTESPEEEPPVIKENITIIEQQLEPPKTKENIVINEKIDDKETDEVKQEKSSPEVSEDKIEEIKIDYKNENIPLPPQKIDDFIKTEIEINEVINNNFNDYNNNKKTIVNGVLDKNTTESTETIDIKPDKIDNQKEKDESNETISFFKGIKNKIIKNFDTLKEEIFPKKDNESTPKEENESPRNNISDIQNKENIINSKIITDFINTEVIHSDKINKISNDYNNNEQLENQKIYQDIKESDQHLTPQQSIDDKKSDNNNKIILQTEDTDKSMETEKIQNIEVDQKIIKVKPDDNEKEEVLEEITSTKIEDKLSVAPNSEIHQSIKPTEKSEKVDDNKNEMESDENKRKIEIPQKIEEEDDTIIPDIETHKIIKRHVYITGQPENDNKQKYNNEAQLVSKKENIIEADNKNKLKIVKKSLSNDQLINNNNEDKLNPSTSSIINANEDLSEINIKKGSTLSEKKSKFPLKKLQSVDSLISTIEIDKEIIEKFSYEKKNRRKQILAALLIQNYWRQFKTRINKDKGIEDKEIQKSNDIIKAVIVIQSMWRGFNVRKHIISKKIEENKSDNNVKENEISETIKDISHKNNNEVEEDLCSKKIEDFTDEEKDAISKIQSRFRNRRSNKITPKKTTKDSEPKEEKTETGSLLNEEINVKNNKDKVKNDEQISEITEISSKTEELNKETIDHFAEEHSLNIINKSTENIQENITKTSTVEVSKTEEKFYNVNNINETTKYESYEKQENIPTEDSHNKINMTNEETTEYYEETHKSNKEEYYKSENVITTNVYVTKTNEIIDESHEYDIFVNDPNENQLKDVSSQTLIESPKSTTYEEGVQTSLYSNMNSQLENKSTTPPPPSSSLSSSSSSTMTTTTAQTNQDAPAGIEIVTPSISNRRAQASDKDASRCATKSNCDSPSEFSMEKGYTTTRKTTSSPSAAPATNKKTTPPPPPLQTTTTTTTTTTTQLNKDMEVEAATKIQAGFRGYQVRKQLKNNKTISTPQQENKRINSSKQCKSSQGSKNTSDLEEKSAVKIQAGVRGFLVRQRQKNQKPSKDLS